MLVPILEMDFQTPPITITNNAPTYIQHTIKPLHGFAHLIAFFGLLWPILF